MSLNFDKGSGEQASKDMPVSYMHLETKPGQMIRFHNYGGYPSERERAASLLTLGAEYEVISLDAGGFSSTVEIAEGRFNTCLFENVN